MHLNGFVHRDIKPANLLILDKEKLNVCVADLGLSCQTSDTDKLIKKCGTPGYIGPELLSGIAYSFETDVFSLGVIFYNLLTGRNIFGGKDASAILKQNRYKDPQKVVRAA